MKNTKRPPAIDTVIDNQKLLRRIEADRMSYDWGSSISPEDYYFVVNKKPAHDLQMDARDILDGICSRMSRSAQAQPLVNHRQWVIDDGRCLWFCEVTTKPAPDGVKCIAYISDGYRYREDLT